MGQQVLLPNVRNLQHDSQDAAAANALVEDPKAMNYMLGAQGLAAAAPPSGAINPSDIAAVGVAAYANPAGR